MDKPKLSPFLDALNAHYNVCITRNEDPLHCKFCWNADFTKLYCQQHPYFIIHVTPDEPGLQWKMFDQEE